MVRTLAEPRMHKWRIGYSPVELLADMEPRHRSRTGISSRRPSSPWFRRAARASASPRRARATLLCEVFRFMDRASQPTDDGPLLKGPIQSLLANFELWGTQSLHVSCVLASVKNPAAIGPLRHIQAPHSFGAGCGSPTLHGEEFSIGLGRGVRLNSSSKCDVQLNCN